MSHYSLQIITQLQWRCEWLASLPERESLHSASLLSFGLL